jgi:hypothetical protein
VNFFSVEQAENIKEQKIKVNVTGIIQRKIIRPLVVLQ